mmetsp:Transcript_34435/g.56277  ORF Transcript_34435/g.56277 Transcript_34435/m.56277 type:complete len:289 (-) Transcript_34435:328-1194(-)
MLSYPYIFAVHCSINVDFTHPISEDPEASPRGMCRYWWVYNEIWGDFHHKDSNMIACTLTTEDIEKLELELGENITEFDNTVINSGLNTIITDLFRYSIGVAYDINLPGDKDCYRCGIPIFPGPKPAFPAQGCAVTGGGGGASFNPDEPAPDLADDECRYRVFPNKVNELWYGSYENWNVGGTIEEFETFVEPIEHVNAKGNKNTIHMAGSATCLNFWGFLQGAYYSGNRAANASIYEIGKNGAFPNDEKLDRNWCEGPAPFFAFQRNTLLLYKCSPTPAPRSLRPCT